MSEHVHYWLVTCDGLGMCSICRAQRQFNNTPSPARNIRVANARAGCPTLRRQAVDDGQALLKHAHRGVGPCQRLVQDFAPGRDTAASRRKLAGFDPDLATESFGISADGTRVVLAGWVQLFSLMECDGVDGLLAPPRAARAAP